LFRHKKPLLKFLIHTLIGSTVFLLTAYLAGWMENSFGVLMFFLIAIGTASPLVALCFPLPQGAGKEDESKNQRQASKGMIAIAAQQPPKRSRRKSVAFSLTKKSSRALPALLLNRVALAI